MRVFAPAAFRYPPGALGIDYPYGWQDLPQSLADTLINAGYLASEKPAGGDLKPGESYLKVRSTSDQGLVFDVKNQDAIRKTVGVAQQYLLRPRTLSWFADAASAVNPEYEAVIDGVYHMRTPGGATYPSRYHAIAPQLLPKVIPVILDSEDWSKVGSVTIEATDSNVAATAVGWRWLISVNTELAFFGSGRRCFLLTADNYFLQIGASNVASTQISYVRVKVAGRDASAHAHVAFHAVGKNPAPANGRASISFGLDDGISTAYTIGAVTLEKYGFKGYFNIIRDRIGTAGYMTDYQVRDLVFRGHEVYCHGPRDMDNGGDLTKYATEAEIAADISYNLEYIRSVGGNPDGYITPRGIGMSPAGDPKINNVLRSLGFKWSRSTIMGTYPKYSAFLREQLDTCNAYNIPIIGHLWAGSDAAEATNISNLCAVADDHVANKLDGTMCNHDFKTIPSAQTHMKPADFDTVVARYALHVAQGRCDCLLPSQQIAANIRNPVPLF